MLRQLQDLRADAAWLADLITPTSSTFITIAQLTTQINKGYYEMFRVVVEAAGDSAYRKKYSITTTSTSVYGANIYDLPGDFYEMKSVELVTGVNDRLLLDRFTAAERPYLASATPGWNGNPFKYCVQGKPGEALNQQVEFLPVPSNGIVIDMYYIYGPTKLVGDTDTVEGFAGFEDYAVLFAAHRCALRGENFDLAAELATERERVRAQILEQMRTIDAFHPPKVQMTRDPYSPRYARRRFG
jgi:hypothetical protein